MGYKRIQVSDTIYSFDIETTTDTITLNDNTTKDLSSMYLACVSCCDFSIQLSQNSPKNISRIGCFRTWKEVNDFFINLNNRHKEELVYIFVHNLSYEFSFRYNLIPLISKCGIAERKDGTQKIISKKGSSNAIQYIQVGNLCFLDSYLITGKSIKTIGNEQNYPKLDYNYSEKRYYYTKLDLTEIDYCFRDTEIAILGVVALCKTYSWVKSAIDIQKTRTSFTRINNQKIVSRYDRASQTKRCKIVNSIDIQTFNDIQRAYFGGYTHANGYFVGQCLHNIHSVDLSSDYPSQMVHRLLPSSKPTVIDIDLAYKVFIQIYDKIKTKNVFKELIKPSLLGGKGYIFDVDFYGVEVKRTLNKNLFPILSSGSQYFCYTEDGLSVHTKVQTEIDTTITDNGRIYKSAHINICLTEIDLLIFLLTYNIKNFSINRCYEYTLSKPTNYFVKVIDYYASIKSNLKKLNRKCENREKITVEHDIEPLEIPAETKHQLINSFKNNDLDTFYSYVNSVYLNSKGDLNGQYGINVENPLKESLHLEPTNLDSVKTLPTAEELVTTIHKDRYKSYLIGSYITAYARASLISFGILADELGLQCVYSDTDSWKIMGNDNIVKDCITLWNNIYLKYIESSGLVNFANKYGIGYFDYEGMYNDFCTIGCKRYLYTVGDHIHATISGLPNASNIYQTYYIQCGYDFSKVVKDIFHFNVIFKNSKLLSNYVSVGDLVKIRDNVCYSGVILQNSDVTLSGIEFNNEYFTKTVEDYYNYITSASVRQYLAILNKYFNTNVPINKAIINVEYKDKKVYKITVDN